MTPYNSATWASTLWVYGSHFRLPPWRPPMACSGAPTLLYGVGEEKKMRGLCGHASLALSLASSSFLTTLPLYAQHLTTLVFFCVQNATPFLMLNILCYSVPYFVSLYPSPEVTISNRLPWSQPPSLEESSTSEPIVTSLFRMPLYEFGMKNIACQADRASAHAVIPQGVSDYPWWRTRIPKPLEINMFLKCVYSKCV